MTRPQTPSKSHYIGVDVSKQHLDLHDRSSKSRIRRTKEATSRWLKSCDADVHVVMEATGGYEALVAELCEQHEIAYSIVNARSVRHFAKPLAFWPRTTQSMRWS